MYPADNQDSLLVLNLSFDLGNQFSIASLYSARFQRTPEGSHQSAACGCHNMVEGCRCRWKLIGIYSVVLGYLTVHTKLKRFLRGGQVGKTLRSFYSFNPNPGRIDNFAHTGIPYV